MRNPKHWYWDRHRIDLIINGDQIIPKVICPHDLDSRSLVEQGEEIETKCGHEEMGFCSVKEELEEIGMEANCTGLRIIVSGPVPIEYGWGDDEIWFKVAGYPTDEEVVQYRKEMAKDLLGDESKYLKIPEEVLLMSPVKPWDQVEDDVKAELVDTLTEHQEAKERRRNAG